MTQPLPHLQSFEACKVFAWRLNRHYQAVALDDELILVDRGTALGGPRSNERVEPGGGVSLGLFDVAKDHRFAWPGFRGAGLSRSFWRNLFYSLPSVAATLVLVHESDKNLRLVLMTKENIARAIAAFEAHCPGLLKAPPRFWR